MATADPLDEQATGSPLDRIVGQPAVVARLRAAVATPVHAYLFVGRRGSGKRQAALAFAAALLSRDVTDAADAERVRRLALAGIHPDVVLRSPEGRSLRVEEARELVVEASRSPIEGRRKVIVCERFHTAQPEAAASLLKTVEEPPATAVFVLLAEDVPAEHVTIASRCTVLEFASLGDDVLTDHLVGRGVDADRAARIAVMAGGNLDRAELLAEDDAALRRFEAWQSVPDRLDGTGAAVAVLVEELRSLIDDAQAPLAARHADEVAQLAAQEELAPSAGARKALAERHKREARLLRDDELRTGLATLAGRYRDLLVADPGGTRWADATAAVTAAAAALVRNPNEPLLLQALLLSLPHAPRG